MFKHSPFAKTLQAQLEATKTQIDHEAAQVLDHNQELLNGAATQASLREFQADEEYKTFLHKLSTSLGEAITWLKKP